MGDVASPLSLREGFRAGTIESWRRGGEKRELEILTIGSQQGGPRGKEQEARRAPQAKSMEADRVREKREELSSQIIQIFTMEVDGGWHRRRLRW